MEASASKKTPDRLRADSEMGTSPMLKQFTGFAVGSPNVIGNNHEQTQGVGIAANPHRVPRNRT